MEGGWGGGGGVGVEGEGGGREGGRGGGRGREMGIRDRRERFAESGWVVLVGGGRTVAEFGRESNSFRERKHNPLIPSMVSVEDACCLSIVS